MENRDEKLERKELSTSSEIEDKTDKSELLCEVEQSVDVGNESNDEKEQRLEQHTTENMMKEKQENRENSYEHPKGLSIFSPKGQSRIIQLEKEKAIDVNAYAGFWIRLCAYLVDLLVIASLRLILVKPIVLLLNLDSDGIISGEKILSSIVFFVYFVLLTKFTGQTLGKMIFGLRVIPLKGDRLTWDTVIFRELVGRYICYKIKILYILVGILPQKQGLHDIFADTCVIHEEVVDKKSVEKLLEQQI